MVLVQIEIHRSSTYCKIWHKNLPDLASWIFFSKVIFLSLVLTAAALAVFRIFFSSFGGGGRAFGMIVTVLFSVGKQSRREKYFL